MLHIDRLFLPAGLLIASVILPAIVTAQAILPTAASATFPQCALSCTQLIQAQNACIPPAQAVTDEFVYATCFCTSPLTAQLRISPDGTCDASCTAESDRVLLQSWFNGFCATETATAQTPTASTTLATQATSSSASSALSTVTTGVSTVIVIIPATSSSSTGSAPTVTGAGSTVGSSSSSNNTWIHTHWRWILMLGLLIIGLGLLAFLAVCLKRRHRRKLDEKRASLSGFPARPPSRRNRTPTPSLGPELWGPHQHMAHTRGWEYNHEEDTSAGGSLGAEKKNKKIRRNQSERGGSRGPSQNRSGLKELDSNAPGVVSEKSNRRRAQEQERERERNRDQYAENRAQSMRGTAASTFERDRDRDQRSQTMREKDKVAWTDRDPEKMDVIEKI